MVSENRVCEFKLFAYAHKNLLTETWCENLNHTFNHSSCKVKDFSMYNFI